MSATAARRAGVYGRAGKRVFDLAVVVLSAPITLPVAGAVAVAVRLAMGSPVLFRQRRPGLGGRPFELVKFRTMRASQGDSDAERLTRFGRLLRASSLDELPELWCVARGDMSLVGPRPLLLEYLPLYDRHQARRHEVRPGITGWAQVHGRNALSWPEKLRYDVEYVERVSFGLDLQILLRTVVQVITRRGIAADGHATMPKFKGEADG